MENDRRFYVYNNRQYIIAGMVIMLLLIFVMRLFFLQIMSDDYKKWADSNAFRKRTLYPSRGMIYDRNGKLLVFNQPSYDVMVVMREVRSLDTLDFCRTMGITKEFFADRMAVIKSGVSSPRYSVNTPQVFMDQLSANEYGALHEKLYKYPGFYIRSRVVREYGYPNAANVLGYVAEVSRTDIEKDDYYVPSDYSGRTGVESSYEKILRGEKGVEILLRDAHGRVKGKYEDGKEDVAPVSGKNITLSIDMELQALGEKLMRNKLGAIVMIEPSTGEILSLVTSPSYDPNLLTGRQFADNYQELNRDPQQPFFDRSIKGYYAPGSTFKPAQALTLLQEGVVTKEKTYTCYGGYSYHADGHPACHIHYPFTSVVYSLSTSCNSYYCWGIHELLDDRSRYPTIQEAFEAWKNHIVSMGYGNPLGIDLPGEGRGFIPNSKTYDNNRNNRWTSSSIISIAFGQGEITATPIQICNLAATIANRGYYVVPHVVREIQDMPLDERYRTKKYTDINQEYYEYMVEGMREAVTEGTCTGLNMWGIDVCAKTGTVENPHGRNHSACIAFAPRNNPKVAIAVYVQNGGTGATLSVPMARLMLQQFFHGEVLEAWTEYRIANWNTSPGSADYIRRIIEEENVHAD